MAQTDNSLRGAVARVESELGGKIEESQLRLLGLEGRLSQFQETLGKQLEAVKVDLLKWSFAFWVPVALALVALYLRG
jgi:hypothetical protein